MDCNSYSYAPDMGAENHNIEEYLNDDMSAELSHYGRCYAVWASSYDGSMDIYETFTAEDVARKLYNHIVTNYADTPPIKRELNKLIRALHREDSAA